MKKNFDVSGRIEQVGTAEIFIIRISFKKSGCRIKASLYCIYRTSFIDERFMQCGHRLMRQPLYHLLDYLSER